MGTIMSGKTAAFETFMRSMKIGFEEWHDGISYNLQALAALPPDELAEVEALLIARRGQDWRDTEALASIASDRVAAALEQGLHASDCAARLTAGEQLQALGRLPDMGALIVDGLEHGSFGDGFAQALRLAAEYPREEVRAYLLRACLHAPGEKAVHFAALLYHLHGRSPEAFDIGMRPFFLRFADDDQAQRRQAYGELCALIGVAADVE